MGIRKFRRYVEGFLAGQVVAYCERINTGAGLVAQLAFPRVYLDELVRLVVQEGCTSAIEDINPERVTLWIYRDGSVKRLIDELQSRRQPSELDIWSMGKLFGYADEAVINFLRRSKSTCSPISSPPPFADTVYLRREPEHSPY